MEAPAKMSRKKFAVVRKGWRGTTWTRTFTSVFGDRTSFRAKGFAGRLATRNFTFGKKHPKCDGCQHNIGIWPTPEEIYCVGQPLRIKNEWMCSRLWKGLTSIRPRTHLEYGNRRTTHRIVYCHIPYSNWRCFRAISYIYFFAYTSIREVLMI